ncbi:hypothetical protein VNO77_04536 [Canavalia gladiata]|uniref:Uncharacterized protein n=1 Tax=Canavalia gladiata TaxID=3824 RepID=A0AAN9N2C0_CANGL
MVICWANSICVVTCYTRDGKGEQFCHKNVDGRARTSDLSMALSQVSRSINFNPGSRKGSCLTSSSPCVDHEVRVGLRERKRSLHTETFPPLNPGDFAKEP